MRAKIASLVLATLLTALAGCTLNQQGLRNEGLIPQIGGNEVVAPKRCVLRVMVASQPQESAALGELVWRVADEQAIDAETRHVLQANGLRIGRISSELPTEVQAVLAGPPPKKKVEAQTVVLPEGEHTLLDPTTSPSSSLSLILGQKDKAVGKVYQDARGFIRLSASFEGDDAVSLRITPELHHGPVQRGWGVAGGSTPMSPQQLITRNGQQEENFRDMACTLTLKPGQLVVLGGRHDKRGSLGDFLFGEPDSNSDRPVQKVIFVWAGRSDSGNPEGQPPSGLVPIDPVGETKAK
jgi:hypothetical protein